MSKNSVTLRAGRDTWTAQNKENQNNRGSKSLSVRGTGGDNGRYGYIYFPVRIPRNATITKANLRLTMATGTMGDGTRTVSVTRIAGGWKQAKTTWKNQPATAGSAVSVTKGPQGPNEQWNFDVRPHMQLVANGTTFYGWRITMGENVIRNFHSSESRVWKPILEIEWNENPYPPTDLNPTGRGFVATGAPVLSWDFRDNRGTTTMGGFQVQLSSTADFTSLIHDSGVKTTNQPVYDLSTASGWTALSTSAMVYWRVKVKDDANNWSDWSDVGSFRYETKGTLTITGPAGSTVSDPSPTVAWSLTGKTQSMWQVVVRNSNNVEIYDSGKFASMDQSWEIPAKVGKKVIIGEKDKSYSIVVRAWDDVDRASTVDSDIRYEAVKTVTYVPSTTVTKPSQPVATDLSILDGGVPGLRLVWTRTEAPDRFDVWRNGVRIDSVEPGEATTGTAGEYRYVDYTTEAGQTYIYSIGASVNGSAGESPIVTISRGRASTGIWLIDPFRDIKVQILGDETGTWEYPEDSVTYAPVGSTSSRLVTQALRGYEGEIEGQLHGDNRAHLNAQLEAFYDLKETPGQDYILVLPEMSLNVIVSNMQVIPTPLKEPVREVSFQFYQQGSLPFRDTL